jgi:hypothetical protein
MVIDIRRQLDQLSQGGRFSDQPALIWRGYSQTIWLPVSTRTPPDPEGFIQS